MTRTVHAVLPNDIDDPARPSGGNTYDRRVCDGLAANGWSVHEHAVDGGWPRPTATDKQDLARVLATVPDTALVLLDGLVASAVPDVLGPEAGRLRLVVLVHLPLEDDAEREALTAARAVITTSEWTRRRLRQRYGLPAHAAPPGVDPAPVHSGSPAGTDLLCIAAVTPLKGHDVLVDALAKVADQPWSCRFVGPLDRDPGFVERLRRQIDGYGLADRIPLIGPQQGANQADLLVVPSRHETYGMVVTEALARGIPVLATTAGGLPETLGHAGLLVQPDDPAALAGALRRWLGDAGLRHELRRAALDRRATLTGWPVTVDAVAHVLDGVPR